MKKTPRRRCRACREWMSKPYEGQILCSIPCAIAYTEKKKEIKRKKVVAANSKQAFMRDRRKQLSLTQAAFNRMRVKEEMLWFKERNLEPVCISCQKPLGNDQWCCGHFRTVGAQAGLRFDRMNVYLQHNYRCNRRLSGDIGGTKTTPGYKRGLAIRFGEEKAQEIIDYCQSKTESVKYSCEQLVEMRRAFNKRTREIEKIFAII